MARLRHFTISSRSLLVSACGVIAAVAATLLLDLHVHIGTEFFDGVLGGCIAAAGGALCALLIDRALRPDSS